MTASLSGTSPVAAPVLKQRAAALSVISNSVLILLKVVAGSLTHRMAHELQDVIGAQLHGADVLIHLEPEDRVRPGEVLSGL